MGSQPSRKSHLGSLAFYLSFIIFTIIFCVFISCSTKIFLFQLNFKHQIRGSHKASRHGVCKNPELKVTIGPNISLCTSINPEDGKILT
jgi:hypothetical protein